MKRISVTKIWFAHGRNMTYQYIHEIDGRIVSSDHNASCKTCVNLVLNAAYHQYEHSKIDTPTGFVEILTWTTA